MSGTLKIPFVYLKTFVYFQDVEPLSLDVWLIIQKLHYQCGYGTVWAPNFPPRSFKKALPPVMLSWATLSFNCYLVWKWYTRGHSVQSLCIYSMTGWALCPPPLYILYDQLGTLSSSFARPSLAGFVTVHAQFPS